MSSDSVPRWTFWSIKGSSEQAFSCINYIWLDHSAPLKDKSCQRWWCDAHEREQPVWQNFFHSWTPAPGCLDRLISCCNKPVSNWSYFVRYCKDFPFSFSQHQIFFAHMSLRGLHTFLFSIVTFFFVMINGQLSVIVSNICLQLKVWFIFKVLFGVTNKHEFTQVHRDIKQASTSIFHSTGCFPVFTVLRTNLTNEQCEPCFHMVCSETLVCLDFCLSENKPTQVENTTLQLLQEFQAEPHRDVKLCFYLTEKTGWFRSILGRIFSSWTRCSKFLILHVSS